VKAAVSAQFRHSYIVILKRAFLARRRTCATCGQWTDPFDFAQGRLFGGKERRLRMTRLYENVLFRRLNSDRGIKVRALVERPALHDKPAAADVANAFGWISLHENKVRELAFRNRTDIFLLL
jgi:hypothetical protein